MAQQELKIIQVMAKQKFNYNFNTFMNFMVQYLFSTMKDMKNMKKG